MNEKICVIRESMSEETEQSYRETMNGNIPLEMQMDGNDISQ